MCRRSCWIGGVGLDEQQRERELQKSVSGERDAR